MRHAGVVRDDHLRARFHGRGAFHLAHGRGDRRKFRGERPAESAAALRLCHLHELEIAHLFQEFARLRLDAEFAQSVAAIVKGDFFWKARADIGDAELVHEEIRELETLGRHGLGGGFARGAGEKLAGKTL